MAVSRRFQFPRNGSWYAPIQFLSPSKRAANIRTLRVPQRGTQTATAGRETYPLAQQASHTLSPVFLAAEYENEWRRRESNSGPKMCLHQTSTCVFDDLIVG